MAEIFWGLLFLTTYVKVISLLVIFVFFFLFLNSPPFETRSKFDNYTDRQSSNEKS